MPGDLPLNRTELAAVLYDAYSDQGKIKKLGDQIGLPARRINYKQKPMEVWDEVFDELDDAGIERLRDAALADPLLGTEWKQKLRDVTRSKRRAVVSQPGVHLLLDRDVPWANLEKATKSPSAHVVLLCGSERYGGHASFIERIWRFGRSRLGVEPLELPVDVYDVPPERALELLCDKLNPPVEAAEVGDTIAALLAERHVVLLYPEIDAPEQEEWLTRHHTEVIPELLARAFPGGPPHSIIALQPISWRSRPWDFLPLLSSKWWALRALRNIKPVPPSLVVWTQEMGRIEKNDLIDFFNAEYATDPHRTRKLERALDILENSPTTLDFFTRLARLT